MKFAIFGLSASVEIRPLPGAWVVELLGVVLGVQDDKKIKFPKRVYSSKAVKGLTKINAINIRLALLAIGGIQKVRSPKFANF